MHKAYTVDSNFNLKLNENSNITLIINSEEIEINYELLNGEYNILVFNSTDSDVKITENGSIKESKVNITYIELNNYKYSQINNLNVYRDSILNINSIYLGVNEKKIKFDITNLEINSIVNVNNNVVCLNDALFELEVIGNIKKGAKSSKCYQKSQCLTFENPKSAKVLPVLNIDENDVEASHSLSSGTIDEEVLFYMNSRGLSKKEALGLLLVSYLMPSEDFYKDYENGLMIKQMAEEKVNELCMM